VVSCTQFRRNQIGARSNHCCARENRLKQPASIIAKSIGNGVGQDLRATPMLAEKFILLIETLRSRSHPDGSTIVVSTSRHVPIELPATTGK
jgi:hypothetical protein